MIPFHSLKHSLVSLLAAGKDGLEHLLTSEGSGGVKHILKAKCMINFSVDLGFII